MSSARRGRPPVEGRREEILDAAVGVFAEEGFDGLSMNQLAKRLGFSSYVLTYHFGSKDAVHAAVAAHVEQEIQREFADLIDSGSASLAQLMRRYWHRTKQPGSAATTRVWLELALRSSRDPENHPELVDKAIDGWREVITTALGHDNDDPEAIAALGFAAIVGLELLQMVRPHDSSSDRAMELLIAMAALHLDSPN